MKYIKVFESFDKDDGDYIVSSIRDILIELEDEGMKVEVEYEHVARARRYAELSKTIVEPGVTIKITGKEHEIDESFPLLHKDEEFEISSIRDYIDTVVDFIEDIWPDYSIYFEKYATDHTHIGYSKVLKDGKCGSIVIQIHKREI